MRSAGRDIVATEAVAGIVIAIVRRFLPGRIEELPCLLYRHLGQLSSPHRETLRRTIDQRKGSFYSSAHPTDCSPKKVFATRRQNSCARPPDSRPLLQASKCGC